MGWTEESSWAGRFVLSGCWYIKNVVTNTIVFIEKNIPIPAIIPDTLVTNRQRFSQASVRAQMAMATARKWSFYKTLHFNIPTNQGPLTAWAIYFGGGGWWTSYTVGGIAMNKEYNFTVFYFMMSNNEFYAFSPLAPASTQWPCGIE